MIKTKLLLVACAYHSQKLGISQSTRIIILVTIRIVTKIAPQKILVLFMVLIMKQV